MEKTDLSLADWQNKAARYCAAAEHCESEVREKFRQWTTPHDFHDEIVDYLYANAYLDEERYARAFVHDKLRYNGWGKIKLRAMLMAKRIGSAAIRSAIDAIDEDEYAAIARKVAAKKKGATPIQLARFMQQRGFEWKL